MNKTKFIAISVLAAMTFAGCSAAPAEVNKAPTVVGVKDIQCMVNSRIDFLDGVAALDYEDGDLTPSLDINVSPAVEVNNGYATFSEEGEYSVTYSVTDSKGRTASKRAYVNVVDRETYKTFALPEGFTAEAYGNAKITDAGLKNGEFKLSATGGVIAEDVVLSRTYTVSDTYYAEGGPCTFHYNINTDKAGKIKIKADGADCAELYLQAGANNVEFMHAPVSGGEALAEVAIDVCLGNLGDMNLTIGNVEIEYPQQAGKEVERAENFKFGGKVESRIDTKAGYSEAEQNADPTVNNGLVGNTWTADGGNEAHLEITNPSTKPETVWAGGMFINTGIALKAGVQYKVSLNATCIHPEGWVEGTEDQFEIHFQNMQWGSDDEVMIDKVYPAGINENGDCEVVLNVTQKFAGSLWLYVMSGMQANEIIIKDLSVVEVLTSTGKDSYAIEDFTCNGGTRTTNNGNIVFNVSEFKENGGDTAIESPSFLVSGSGGNYVLTFKAKATAPIEAVVAIPVAGGWDPTILWQKVRLSQEETIFTFMCNKNDADRLHKIAWQFGSAFNTQYSNVTIEISDIRICLKNGQLDT